MRLTNNEGVRGPTGHLLLPNEVSSPSIVLHLVELSGKRVPWEPDRNAPLLKTTSTQLREYMEVKLVLT